MTFPNGALIPRRVVSVSLLLAVYLIAAALAGCSAAPAAQSVKALPNRAAVDFGAWYLGATPDEGRLEELGFHGYRIWELSHDSLRAAVHGEVYAWAIMPGDSMERPAEALPPRAQPGDSIGSFRVGIDSYWYEHELRRKQAKALTRVTLFLRSKLHLENTDGGWGH